MGWSGAKNVVGSEAVTNFRLGLVTASFIVSARFERFPVVTMCDPYRPVLSVRTAALLFLFFFFPSSSVLFLL